MFSAAAKPMRCFLAMFLATSLSGTCKAQNSGSDSSPDSADEIRAVIVLARHGVRAPLESEIRASNYNAQPWPSWPAAPGMLTQHGAEALRLLGEYYRSRYPSLLGDVSCDRPGIYAAADTSERTIASGTAMLAGIAPGCAIEVHHPAPGQRDQLFPASAAAGRQQLADAINGRMANQPEWFTNAFALPLARMHHVLMDCSGKDCDRTKADFRTAALKKEGASRRAAVLDRPVAMGADFAEHFLLEYTEGMPMSQVGWGRVSRGDSNQLMEMNTRYHDFVQRTPYLAQGGTSDFAKRIRDTILSFTSGNTVSGRIGGPEDRFMLVVGHDGNLASLGGLLRLDWLLPDQTFDATPPGGALVFEVHKNAATGACTVEVFFISQTLDQMRYLRPLKGTQRPSVAPIFVPGCSGPGPAYACSAEGFDRVVTAAVEAESGGLALNTSR